MDERVESVRQQIGDKRANPDGRVPDDVWDFPRVVGNAKERRDWHPTQHPEALMRRIINYSCRKDETFLDLFLGTGTSFRVRKENVIGIEQSEKYCQEIAKEHDIVYTPTATG
jgi:site-specific DNA-methyltransferase (adenine-specific)